VALHEAIFWSAVGGKVIAVRPWLGRFIGERGYFSRRPGGSMSVDTAEGCTMSARWVGGLYFDVCRVTPTTVCKLGDRPVRKCPVRGIVAS